MTADILHPFQHGQDCGKAVLVELDAALPLWTECGLVKAGRRAARG